jgi:hypothetical protein
MKSKAYKLFGGFTNDKWSSSGKTIEGKGTFIFSLHFKRIFPQLREWSLCCSSELGPVFGDAEIAVGYHD